MNSIDEGVPIFAGNEQGLGYIDADGNYLSYGAIEKLSDNTFQIDYNGDTYHLSAIEIESGLTAVIDKEFIKERGERVLDRYVG